MTVGEKIKKIRISRGLTQKGLAEKAGVLKQSVSAWERGVTQPSTYAIEKISKVLDVNPNTFRDKIKIVTHWVSVKKRPPEKSGKYVCAALLPDERGGVRELISVYTFERTSDADKAGRWEAPRSIIAYWLEGLELPDMEGIL